MRDIKEMLQRQAKWQQGRAKLSWAEKIRAVERVRGDVLALRQSLRRATTAPPRQRVKLTLPRQS